MSLIGQTVKHFRALLPGKWVMFVKADKRNSLSRFKADNINGKVCVENDEI